MPTNPTPRLGRRQLLQQGGAVITLGAFVAACGSGRGGSTDPGRVGLAPPPASLPDGEVNDVVLLRTAQSIEYSALDVYAAASDLGVLSAGQETLVNRFVADHTGHGDLVGGLITDLGGDEFRKGNPWLAERTLAPVFAALATSDDPLRDVISTAYAFEQLAAESYQALVGLLTDPSLRREAMSIGVDENRHAAALAIASGGAGAYVNPEITGGEAEVGELGVSVPYAIPSTFGQLNAVQLVVGALDEEGSRTDLLLQTPAANALVYEYLV